jgi:RHS repeat-associated protein
MAISTQTANQLKLVKHRGKMTRGRSYVDEYVFQGTRRDTVTGLDYDSERWCDSNSGTWISRDPGGFAMGDANLYRAMGNALTNAVDPSGLWSWVGAFRGAGAGLPVGMLTPLGILAPAAGFVLGGIYGSDDPHQNISDFGDFLTGGYFSKALSYPIAGTSISRDWYARYANYVDRNTFWDFLYYQVTGDQLSQPTSTGLTAGNIAWGGARVPKGTVIPGQSSTSSVLTGPIVRAGGNPALARIFGKWGMYSVIAEGAWDISVMTFSGPIYAFTHDE